MKPTVFAAAALALCQAHAAEPAAASLAANLATSGDLPVVIITGSMPLPTVEQARDAIAAPVQTADAQQIARSGALDLSAFLRRNLGSVVVNEVQNNPFQPDVSYRGYTASPLLGTPQGLSVYLDGMRLNQPFGDVVSWDLIPRMAIASLTLMPGSNPLFGLNTLGGALAIQSKDGRNSPGTAVEARLGANQRRGVEFEHGGSNAQGWHWYVTGNRYKEEGWRDDSPSDVRQAFGKLGWSDARTQVAATLAHADNALTGNGLQEQRLLARDYRSVYTKPDLTQNRATMLNLTARHQASDSLLLSANAYYRKIDTHTFNGDLNDESLDQSVYQPGAAERAALAAAGYAGFPASGANAGNTPFPKWRCIANVLLNDEPAEKCNGMLNRSHTQQDNHGFSGQFTWLAGVAGTRHAVTGGAAYDASHATFRQTSQFGYLNPDRSITPVNFFADGTQIDDDGTPVDNRVDLRGRMRTWSVYASDSMAFNQDLTLTVSGRYNRSTVRNRDAITPGGGSGSLDGDHRYSRFNPAIGLAYAPAAGSSAYLGYNEGSRTPTAIELGCADPENPCRLPNAMAGDPPLKQVVTKTWEAGVRGQWGSMAKWSAGVFRAENHDDILFVADNQAGFGYFKNFGKTRHQGVELALDGKEGGLDFGVNYTWLQATYQSRETVNGSANSSSDAEAPGLEGHIVIAPGNRIPLTPSHLLKAHVDYAGGRDWTLGLAMTAVSGAYARGNENNRHQPGGASYLGAGKSGGYAVVELNGRYQLTPRLSVFAQVSNLFDRKYATAAQLGATGFDANGNFAARPLPAVGGAYPMVNATFYAAGAPRAINVDMRYAF
ncbi:TonB-dependent receptor [Janthinobacterium sp. 1_2014MBL_MicDiv]|uniref:TonB-dependent receptor n=1 Tax=Janthinobacterium sp. 1_2014MBL_MicDiv TaxID=1644131 RepID=UPI0008F4A7F2|nr:TonB-dependent receptor [Janthinobacterium sp. 1_2014MBL_MicDiv]APA70328.1 TonB-dependent receptor [Janthinobacterium sp. 1_2014MBL_MicDiv]